MIFYTFNVIHASFVVCKRKEKRKRTHTKKFDIFFKVIEDNSKQTRLQELIKGREYFQKKNYLLVSQFADNTNLLKCTVFLHDYYRRADNKKPLLSRSILFRLI